MTVIFFRQKEICLSFVQWQTDLNQSLDEWRSDRISAVGVAFETRSNLIREPTFIPKPGTCVGLQTGESAISTPPVPISFATQNISPGDPVETEGTKTKPIYLISFRFLSPHKKADFFLSDWLIAFEEPDQKSLRQLNSFFFFIPRILATRQKGNPIPSLGFRAKWNLTRTANPHILEQDTEQVARKKRIELRNWSPGKMGRAFQLRVRRESFICARLV